MPAVLPFRALRFVSLEEGARRVPGLSGAPDPWAVLRRWEEQGDVIHEDPALYLVETKPWDSHSPHSAVRFLLGAMSADLPELEGSSSRSSVPTLDPVPVLAADDDHSLRDLFASIANARPPVWESRLGSQHLRMWRIGSSQEIRRVHRLLDASKVRPHGEIPEDGQFLAAVVPLSEPGLRFLPYHRGVRGLPAFDPERFLALVSDYARVYELERSLDDPGGLDEARARLAALAPRQHGFLLVLPRGESRLLRFRQALELSLIPAAPRSPTLRSLDLALLNSLVLRTVLGLRDPESPKHPNVFPVESVSELVRQVEEGVFQAGFVLNPPPLWEVRAVMEAAQALPPRTVRVAPSPPAGLLFLDPQMGA
jgi:hypothetical protein